MSNTGEKSRGGFHFGNVGGGVNFNASGDIVAGDKTTTTTIQRGFTAEEQKQQFQVQIDQLRDALRTVKAEIEANPSLSDDQKEEAAGEILQHVKALKEVKEKTASAPAGQPAPAEVASVVESTLKSAGSVMDLLQGLANRTVGLAETAGKFAVTYGPLILNARHLFGLP